MTLSTAGEPPEPHESARSYRVAGSDLPGHFEHQFAPWRFAAADPGRGYAGTLLRLPLRTRAQAAASAISKVMTCRDAID